MNLPGTNAHCILVNEKRQKGNDAILSNIRNVPWEYVKNTNTFQIIPDFIPNPTTAVFFCSLRYHLL